MFHPTGRAREDGVRRTLYAMASTMGEDPNAFSGCLVWRTAQQCNNWQRCAMKTASALTVVKILVVHSRFPFANFHGHLGSP